MTLSAVPPLMRIDIYTHYVKVTRFNAAGKNALLEYCRTLAQYGLVRVGRNQFERQVLRVYVATTKDRSEFRFHINEYQNFRQHLSRYGFTDDNIEIVRHQLYKPVEVSYPLRDTREPRERQVPILKYLCEPPLEGYSPAKVATLQTGGGKAQPLTAHIRVPGGWKFMGDISVGDEIITQDGSVTKVTGVYPQGVKKIYRVVFADGRWTECCPEHLWKVFYINTSVDRRWRVVDTEEMLRLISMPNPRVYVDLIEPEDKPDVDLPVDPYLLGCLLGDGHLGANKVGFSSVDQEIIDQVSALLPHDTTLRKVKGDNVDYRLIGQKGVRNSLLDAMRVLGLAAKRSWEKEIPVVFIEASRSQRLSLLQGLMDTDGTVGSDNGRVSFSTASFTLAHQVQYLVRSLGGIASISRKTPSYTYNGEVKRGRVSYTVGIRYKKPSDLFRLERKRLLAKEKNQYSDTLKLRVKSIEVVGEKPAQCISVEHPSRLYVTDDFIVTHNTFLGLRAVHTWGTRAVLVLKGMYVDKWIEDVESAYLFKRGDLMVVRGSDHLRALIELAKSGKLEAKFIIVSLKTMYQYLEAYEEFKDSEQFPYPVPPEKFYETLGAGIRLIDEVHQEFHTNFRQDLYTHVPLTISLSATLDSDDRFMNRMYEIVWPLKIRSPEVPYDKFIVMKALWYTIHKPEKMRYTNHMKQYSHVKFEQSIMKHVGCFNNYKNMIAEIVKRSYVSVRSPGQKMLIFCATVELCTYVRDHLAALNPHLTVNRYVSEDEYEKLLNADIVVSTLQSAGTAVDIPNLRITLMTVALSSKQANIQALGRTRRLKDWPDINPEFLFLNCREIDKHRTYAEEKKVKMDGKVLSFKDIETEFRV